MLNLTRNTKNRSKNRSQVRTLPPPWPRPVQSRRVMWDQLNYFAVDFVVHIYIIRTADWLKHKSYSINWTPSPSMSKLHHERKNQVCHRFRWESEKPLFRPRVYDMLSIWNIVHPRDGVISNWRATAKNGHTWSLRGHKRAHPKTRDLRHLTRTECYGDQPPINTITMACIRRAARLLLYFFCSFHKDLAFFYFYNSVCCYSTCILREKCSY